jgi:hypothetical protein
MTYQHHQSEDLALKPVAFRPCPDPELCIKGDACAGKCSQPEEAAQWSLQAYEKQKAFDQPRAPYFQQQLTDREECS